MNAACGGSFFGSPAICFLSASPFHSSLCGWSKYMPNESKIRWPMATILKIEKNYNISKTFNQFWWNLVCCCTLALWTMQDFKISRWRITAVLKIEISWLLQNGFTDYDEIWHDEFSTATVMSSFEFKKFKVMHGNHFEKNCHFCAYIVTKMVKQQQRPFNGPLSITFQNFLKMQNKVPKLIINGSKTTKIKQVILLSITFTLYSEGVQG